MMIMLLLCCEGASEPDGAALGAPVINLGPWLAAARDAAAASARWTQINMTAKVTSVGAGAADPLLKGHAGSVGGRPTARDTCESYWRCRRTIRSLFVLSIV
jgi:hypothetical protein